MKYVIIMLLLLLSAGPSVAGKYSHAADRAKLAAAKRFPPPLPTEQELAKILQPLADNKRARTRPQPQRTKR